MLRPHPLPTPALALLLLVTGRGAGGPPEVTFASKPGRVEIHVGGRPLGAYVYRDEQITRPYLAHLRAPGGMQVTRHHPPVKGKDATDHDTLHPGLWLAFGDLGGADSWRNRARVEHEKFLDGPRGGPGRGTFAVVNRYLAADGRRVLCRETHRLTVLVRPAGYLLLWDSAFGPEGRDLAFGDQEEMGLGVRLATPLTVKGGGRILNSAGARNEKQVWGKTAEWCDYSGVVEDKHAGVTLMPDPKNFRPCWFHARDYGLLVANPFGQKSLGRGPVSRVVVRPGDALRLRFGVLLHGGAGKPPDLAAAYQDFLRQLAQAVGTGKNPAPLPGSP